MTTALVIARNTVGEAIRKKILQAFVILGLLLIIISLLFGYFSAREELVIIKSVSFAAIWIFGLLISVILCVQMIPTEAERRTLYTILSKPVKRSEFIVGKFLGAAFTVLISTAAMGLVFVVVVYSKSNTWDFGLLKGVFSTYLMLLLVCSLSIFLSVVVTPFLNFLLTFFVIILGSLSDTMREMAVGSKSQFVKLILEWVQRVIPNMGFFNVQSKLIHPEVSMDPVFKEWFYYFQVALYAVVYTTILVALAVYSFEKREV
jgi:ABC-type transport system involved in multi-copper enzyme maturation permease subunit